MDIEERIVANYHLTYSTSIEREKNRDIQLDDDRHRHFSLHTLLLIFYRKFHSYKHFVFQHLYCSYIGSFLFDL